jgi:hypothetical protein
MSRHARGPTGFVLQTPGNQRLAAGIHILSKMKWRFPDSLQLCDRPPCLAPPWSPSPPSPVLMVRPVSLLEVFPRVMMM